MCPVKKRPIGYHMMIVYLKTGLSYNKILSKDVCNFFIFFRYEQLNFFQTNPTYPTFADVFSNIFNLFYRNCFNLFKAILLCYQLTYTIKPEMNTFFLLNLKK